MALTVKQIENAKPKDKKYSLSAGKSLFLVVSPAGGKLWKYRYRIDGKASEYSMGSYPDISLAEASEKVLALRKVVQQGVHPEWHLLKLFRVTIFNDFFAGQIPGFSE